MAPLQSQSVTFCGLAKVLAKPNYELGISSQPPVDRAPVKFAEVSLDAWLPGTMSHTWCIINCGLSPDS